MAKFTIRDVAREARLSVASVSRALNGATTVTPETRDHVRAVADRMGYVAHAGARSLSLSRTQTVGVLLPDLHGEFFSELVRGMDRATAGRGLAMLFSTLPVDAGAAGQATRAMYGRADGLIVMAPQFTAVELAALLPAAMPAVLVNSPPQPGRDGLRFDNRAGVEAMVRHLLARGRRRIVHLTGPAHNLDAQERLCAVRETMAALAPDLPLRIVAGDFQEETGARVAHELLAAGEPFDAIFAANDSMALGALLALREAGVAVPGQVAIAGFDDVPPARYLGMTTLRVPLAEIGERAVAALAARLDAPTGAGKEEQIVPELVVRASTGAAG